MMLKVPEEILEELSMIVSLPKEDIQRLLRALNKAKKCKVVFESEIIKITLEKDTFTDDKLIISSERRFML